MKTRTLSKFFQRQRKCGLWILADRDMLAGCRLGCRDNPYCSCCKVQFPHVFHFFFCEIRPIDHGF
ncbi:hypothetical protein NC653_019263 [Populus alba x Populus x berolinensis]|uniref:Uncharacterized protein n=1 Tax=Populus alba x Populus x berolinensis TaxID=444605 RepID=A0AAD6VXD2_9ROSI|nr:hypothetical protein NC653_019263 [Populus alba x Populus x berolinensis]